MTDIMRDLAARERALPTKPTRDAYARGDGPAADYEMPVGPANDDLREAKAFTYNIPFGLALWVGGAALVWAIWTMTA